MSINHTCGLAYCRAHLLGDVNAVNKGHVGCRVARRAARRDRKRLGKVISAVGI